MLNEEKSFIAMCKFLLWLFTASIITFIGISGVFADTLENIGYLNDDSYISVKVGYTSQQLFLTRTNQYQLSQVEELYIEVENYNFLSGTTYSLEFYTPNTTLSYANAFGVYGETSNGQPIICQTAGITYDDIQHLNFRFNCPSTVNYLKINIFNSSNNYIMDTGIFSWHYVYLRKITSGTNTSIIESQNAQIIQGQQDIINGANDNTQDIIDNSNDNTQDIIDNANDNTDRIIADNKQNFQTCRNSYNLFNIASYDTLTTLTGSSNSNWAYIEANKYYNRLTNYNISDIGFFFTVEPNKVYTLSVNFLQFATYNNSYNLARLSIRSVDENNNGTYLYNNGSINTLGVFSVNFTSTTDKVFIAFNNIALSGQNTLSTTPLVVGDIMINEGNIAYPYEPYGVEICKNKLDEQTDAINGLNDNLNNDDITGATSEASNFFSSFTTNTFGLTSIITAPLNLIQSLTSSTCSQLHLPLPYLDNKYLDLPCMTSIYQTHFGSFFIMYQTITYGIIAYWVCVRIFNQVKDFKNPEHDEIEVVDL